MKGRPGIARRETLHPIIEQLFAEAARQKLTMQNIADVTGMARETLSHWQHRRREPSLTAVEAALGAVNLGLSVTPLAPSTIGAAAPNPAARGQSFRKTLLSRGKVRHGPNKMQRLLAAGVSG